MIRHKGQSSQAKHERYPAIIIFFGKSHQSAETRESQRKRPCAKNRRNDCRSPFCLQARFTGKSLFFHVLPVIENFAKSSVAHRRLAKQLRICSPDHHQRDAGTAFFKQKRFPPHSSRTGKIF